MVNAIDVKILAILSPEKKAPQVYRFPVDALARIRLSTTCRLTGAQSVISRKHTSVDVSSTILVELTTLRNRQIR